MVNTIFHIQDITLDGRTASRVIDCLKDNDHEVYELLVEKLKDKYTVTLEIDMNKQLNRRIEFRAKHHGKWVYGWLYKDGNMYIISTKDSKHFEILEKDYASIGQYVGQLDVCGKMIFEGDILSCEATDNPEDSFSGEVKFQDCGFVCLDSLNKCSGNALTHESYSIKVIGNKINNPDLLLFHCRSKDIGKGKCESQCFFCRNVYANNTTIYTKNQTT